MKITAKQTFEQGGLKKSAGGAFKLAAGQVVTATQSAAGLTLALTPPRTLPQSLVAKLVELGLISVQT